VTNLIRRQQSLLLGSTGSSVALVRKFLTGAPLDITILIGRIRRVQPASLLAVSPRRNGMSSSQKEIKDRSASQLVRHRPRPNRYVRYTQSIGYIRYTQLIRKCYTNLYGVQPVHRMNQMDLVYPIHPIHRTAGLLIWLSFMEYSRYTG
jgi:hypothetical protein